MRSAGSFRGVCAPWLWREPRNAIEDDAQDALVGAGCRQVQADLGLHLDHPRSDLDEAQTQRVELRDGKLERFGIAASRPHMSQ